MIEQIPEFPTLTIIRHPLVQHKLTILRDRDTPTKIFKELVDEKRANPDDKLMSHFVHAEIEDGRTMNDDEIAESQKSVNDFSDIHFMNRVFVNRCGPFAVRHMSVTIEEGRVEWDETTDEGGTTVAASPHPAA